MFSKEMIFSKYDFSDKEFPKRRKHMSSSEPELLFKGASFRRCLRCLSRKKIIHKRDQVGKYIVIVQI